MDTQRSAARQPQNPLVMLPGAARYWWVALVAGVAWLVIAWLVLRANVTSLATVGVLIGIVLVIAAVNEAALASVMSGGWKFLHYAISAIFVLGGLWAFIRPINTFFALASVLGLILFLQGAFELVRGIASRGENPYWWAGLVSGILLILLAFWVSSSDRDFNLAARSTLILLWVAFMALFRGISDIILAFTMRRLGHDVAHVESAVTGSDPGAIAPQPRRAPEPTQAATPRP